MYHPNWIKYPEHLPGMRRRGKVADLPAEIVEFVEHYVKHGQYSGYFDALNPDLPRFVIVLSYTERTWLVSMKPRIRTVHQVCGVVQASHVDVSAGVDALLQRIATLYYRWKLIEAYVDRINRIVALFYDPVKGRREDNRAIMAHLAHHGKGLPDAMFTDLAPDEVEIFEKVFADFLGE